MQQPPRCQIMEAFQPSQLASREVNLPKWEFQVARPLQKQVWIHTFVNVKMWESWTKTRDFSNGLRSLNLFMTFTSWKPIVKIQFKWLKICAVMNQLLKNLGIRSLKDAFHMRLTNVLTQSKSHFLLLCKSPIKLCTICTKQVYKLMRKAEMKMITTVNTFKLQQKIINHPYQRLQ